MAASDDLEERLRALLARWDYSRSPAEVVALGAGAFARLLDAVEGRSLYKEGADPREYDTARRHAVAAFARSDLDAALAEMRRRGWSDERMALSGIGLVADARVTSLLLALVADKSSMSRLSAVAYLGAQRDPRATEALARALSDRSSDVRYAAIQSLIEAADENAIAPLQDFARRAKEPHLAKEAKSAIAKIRKALRSRK